MELEFSLLKKTHDVGNFNCGIEELNRFLAHFALPYQQRHFGVTIVLVDKKAPEHVIGCYTLCPASIERDELPEKVFKGPRPNPIPGFRLCRLALHEDFQKKGLGSLLLIHALKKCLDQANQIGGSFVVIDAKDQEAKRFYEKFGFVTLPKNNLVLIQSIKFIRDHL